MQNECKITLPYLHILKNLSSKSVTNHNFTAEMISEWNIIMETEPRQEIDMNINLNMDI